MDILLESMTKLDYPPYKIRVWREELENLNIIEENRVILIEEIKDIINKQEKLDELDLGKKILSLEGINAVEVLLKFNDTGVVLYNGWP